MKKIFAGILFLLPFLGMAQQEEKGLPHIIAIKEATNDIISNFNQDSIAVAYKLMREIWILPEEELDRMENQSTEQLGRLNERFGEYIDYKLVRVDEVEDVLYRISYVLRYEKHGLRVVFQFYKGKGDLWYLNQFNWDDALTRLFE